jgi:hypothetical protein
MLRLCGMASRSPTSLLARRNGSALVYFEEARTALARATRVEEVKGVRDKAEALRHYFRQAGESLVMQNQCAEIKIRAERRAGELLAERPTHVGGRPAENPSHDARGFASSKLADLGINYSQSSRWQTLANLPEETVERYIAETNARGDELTSAGLLRLAKLGVHFSSESAEWNTPSEIIERVLALFGGRIDLDPCSNSATKPSVPVAKHLTPKEDGLSRVWMGRVYMNPPYGQEIGRWVEHLCKHYEAKAVSEAIALFPSRTDTEWFERLREYPRCFLRGRLRFSGHENTAPFPSMVVYLGNRASRFARIFGPLGDVYELSRSCR